MCSEHAFDIALTLNMAGEPSFMGMEKRESFVNGIDECEPFCEWVWMISQSEWSLNQIGKTS